MKCLDDLDEVARLAADAVQLKPSLTSPSAAAAAVAASSHGGSTLPSLCECRSVILAPRVGPGHPLSFLVGSRPSDHYFRSVCLFACAEFFSAVFDPIPIKLGHMLYVWVWLCPLEYRGCATPGGWVTPKNLYF